MNKKTILENIYQNFRAKTGCGIVIGVEQEFYISAEDLPQIPIDLVTQSLCKFPFFSDPEKERGENQLEVQIYPTDNPAVMADMVERLRGVITMAINQCDGALISFAAKPFPAQPGSALHININLTDDSGRNLFMKNDDEESLVFKQSIAGLLDLMPASIKYFAPYEEAYVRYTNHGMESPSTISWGPDNRTVSLRIPSVPVAMHTRRIEHRLPCADSDPYLVIAAIIAGIEFGIVNKLENKHPKIFGNAFLPQYNLPKLPQSFAEAQAIGHEYLDMVMNKFMP